MKYILVFFFIQTIVWTFAGWIALADGQVKDPTVKIGVLIAVTSFWGVIASWKYLWKVNETK